MRESILQAKIIKALESAGWFVVKLIQTSKNGIPDLLCLKNKEVVFIEVKAEKNKPSPLQMYVMGKIKEQNVKTIIAYDLKDINAIIKSGAGV